jgi:hypothetical protein
MHHVMQVKGAVIERGPDGMLFRLDGACWKATGRWCLTSPWRPNPDWGSEDGVVKTDGIQRDPDGEPWMFIEGNWVEV